MCVCVECARVSVSLCVRVARGWLRSMWEPNRVEENGEQEEEEEAALVP